MEVDWSCVMGRCRMRQAGCIELSRRMRHTKDALDEILLADNCQVSIFTFSSALHVDASEPHVL